MLQENSWTTSRIWCTHIVSYPAAEYQVAEAAAKGVDKLPSATSPSQQKILPAEQESGPTSPFANLAGQQPPEVVTVSETSEAACFAAESRLARKQQ